MKLKRRLFQYCKHDLKNKVYLPSLFTHICLLFILSLKQGIFYLLLRLLVQIYLVKIWVAVFCWVRILSNTRHNWSNKCVITEQNIHYFYFCHTFHPSAVAMSSQRFNWVKQRPSVLTVGKHHIIGMVKEGIAHLLTTLLSLKGKKLWIVTQILCLTTNNRKFIRWINETTCRLMLFSRIANSNVRLVS